MNSAEVSLIVKARDEASKTLGGIKGAIADVAKTAAGFAIGQGIVGGLKAVGGQLGSLVSEAREARMNMAQTNAVLESTGGIAGVTASQVTKLADHYQSLTNFTDDQVQSTENLLLTFTAINKDIFPETTGLALDMSQALGQDLKSSAIQLGKALNDPITGATALRRVGVALTEQQMDQIKAFQESGDILKAQRIILDEVAREFGGSAKAAADPMIQLGNQFDEIKEKAGLALYPALMGGAKLMTRIFIPALSKGIDKLSEFGAAGMRRVRQFFGAFEDSPFSGLTIEIGKALGISSRDLGGWQTNVRAIFREIGDRARNAFEPAIEAFGDLRKTAGETLTRIGAALATLAPILAKLGAELLPILIDVINLLAVSLTSWWRIVLTLISALALGISEIIKWADKVGLLDGLIAGLRTVIDGLRVALDVLAPIMQRVVQFFAEHKEAAIALAAVLGIILIALFPIPAAIIAIITVIGLLREHWESIRGVTLAVWDAITSRITEAVNTVRAALESWGILQIIEGTFMQIQGVVQVYWSIIEGIIRIGLALLRGDWDGAWNAMKDMLAGVWDGIKLIIAGKIEELKGLIRFAANFGGLLFDAGMELLQGLLNGIEQKWDDVIQKVKDLGSAIKNGIKGVLGIGSPSKVFHEYGVNLIEGLAQGIESSRSTATKAVKTIGAQMQQAAADLRVRVSTGAEGVVVKGVRHVIEATLKQSQWAKFWDDTARKFGKDVADAIQVAVMGKGAVSFDEPGLNYVNALRKAQGKPPITADEYDPRRDLPRGPRGLPNPRNDPSYDFGGTTNYYAPVTVVQQGDPGATADALTLAAR